MSGQILKAIRESPLPDYSRYIEEVEGLKKEIMERNERDKQMKDKVEIFDFSKYNFVTPIMKPAAMERGELLDGVMNNYRRFYMKKALFHYPWRGTGFRRRYLLGCLFAFLKAGVGRTFYDLGKVGYTGPQSKNKLDFHFDETRQLAEAQLEDWEAAADRAAPNNSPNSP